MNNRKVVFVQNEIYHIYNRSIAKEQIFTNPSQLRHIYETVNYYRYLQPLKFSDFRKMNPFAQTKYVKQQQKALVEIYAFSFMPNHYHLLIKQLQENGIQKFISNTQNSYAKYFNTKYDRHGSLFQSPFQGKWVESDEQFAHVSRYIHLNQVTSYIIPIEKLIDCRYASYGAYVGKTTIPWINTNKLLNLFPSAQKYKLFVEDQVDYQRTLAELKDIILD